MVTTKKTFWKGVLVELLWLMRGETNIKFLTDRGVTIWNEWSDSNGDLGPVYGKSWRDWKYVDEENSYNAGNKIWIDSELKAVDQLTSVIERIKTKPDCRRLIVSAWNAGMIDKMKLPPCHSLFQFYVRNGKLSCQLYQRSADLFLGVPFNIASYACLTHLIANECDLEVGDFVHTFGDLHLYNNHLDQAKILLEREPLSLPKLIVNLAPGTLMDFVDNQCHKMSWDEIKETIKLTGYKSHGTLKGDVSV
jgi:thymidylate synthase